MEEEAAGKAGGLEKAEEGTRVADFPFWSQEKY